MPLLHAVADASSLAFYAVDERSDGILYVNRRFFDIWRCHGLEDRVYRGELVNSQVLEQIRPLLKEGSGLVTPLSQHNGAATEEELPLVDGRIIRRSFARIRNAETHWGSLYTFEDITHHTGCDADLRRSREQYEYRRAREALQESEDRFKSFMDHTPVLAWMKDEQGRYVYANRMWQEHLGFSHDEWRHLTDEAIFPSPDLARQCRNGDLAVFTSGKPYEGLEVSVDATRAARHWWVLKFPFQDRQGTRYAGGIAVDVTERIKAERSLQDSEQRYHALYEDNPTMFFTLAVDGTVLSVNSYRAAQLGYTPHELMGRSVLDVFHREDRPQVLDQLAACLTNVTKTITWELRKVRKDGTVLWVRECARAVRDPKGSVVVLVVCEDITERKLAEKALRRAQIRMQAIQAERERLAHDLHDNIIQRLYAIGMGLEEGRYRLKERVERPAVSALLARTIGEVNLVIEDVRNFLGGKDPLNFLNSSTIARQFRRLARKTALGPAITVRIDKGATDQMSSLLARHLYLIAREAVSNILRHSRATKGSVHLGADRHSIILTVRDNGIGFRPAGSTAGRFGLKTMRARAKKIGARFRLRSRERRGTVIVVELPKEMAG